MKTQISKRSIGQANHKENLSHRSAVSLPLLLVLMLFIAVPTIAQSEDSDPIPVSDLESDLWETVDFERTNAAFSAMETTPSQQANGYLGQNDPNPVSTWTLLPYFIPEGSKEGVVELFNDKGELKKTFISEIPGEGVVALGLTGLETGSYYYILNVDGTKVDRREMEIVAGSPDK
jgi:hypothetical protein